MAIQFRILFALGLLIFNGSMLSAQTHVNNALSETPIKFTQDTLSNPTSVQITADNKNNPSIYLHCQVTAQINNEIRKDLIKYRNFYFQNSDDESDDNNSTHYSDDEVKKFYDAQTKKFNKPVAVNSQWDKQKLYKAVKPTRNNKKQTITTNESDDEDDEDDEDYEDEKPEVQGVKHRTKRQARELQFTYEWFRDDHSIFKLNSNDKEVRNEGFTGFSNGTIKFKPSKRIVGVYRCKAKFTFEDEQTKNVDDETYNPKFDIGPILSYSTVVVFYDENESKKVTVREQESTLIPCPVVSGIIRESNIAWYFNNNVINFDKTSTDEDGRRHHLLRNGSLLITKARPADSGIYKCNVTNQFSSDKKLQNSLTTLVVMSRNGNDDSYVDDNEKALLSKLQHSMYKIKAGDTLELFCVSNWQKEKTSWTFLPRNHNQTTLLSETSNDLKLKNVSMKVHDGIYNCSNGHDFMVYDVIITSPPILLNQQSSMKTQLTATIKFNCSASANPSPILEWYRNGEIIKNSYIKYSRFSVLKILSVEPSDEGVYQCFARNEFGEASTTFYVHVNPRNILNEKPLHPKCHTTDDGDLNVTFTRRKDEKYSFFPYMAAYEDLESDSGISNSIDSHFIIKRSDLRSAKSLKPFHLYIRSMLKNNNNYIMSRLSEPMICAFQQIVPKFVKANNGSFLGWDIDVPEKDLNKTIITIQFLKNGSSDALSFINEVVGSYEKFDDFKTWNDIEKSLQKISVNSSDRGAFTEIKVPGNVTGILIIKVEEIFVRIFGSIEENGTHIQQDYESIKWKSLKSPYETVNVFDIQSRSIMISWIGLDSHECLKACTYLKQDISPKFFREKSTKLNCEKILNPSAKSFYISKLSPTSDYDVFITDCVENNDLSTRVNIQTLRDVPGPISNTSIGYDRGIVLKWDLPKNPNGKIFYFAIEWTLHDVTHNINVTEHEFRFPNTKITDRFNITVRAIGEGGVGNPLHTYPERWKNLLPMNSQSPKFDPFMIFTIILISLLLLMLVVGLVLCKQNRFCKNNNNGIINSEQSSFSPASQCMENNMIRNDEMLEMQTLISTSSQSNVRVNGKDNSIKSEIHVPSTNGNILGLETILRTSTPTEELPKINCIALLEDSIKCDDTRKTNGFIKTFQSSDTASNTLISILPTKAVMMSPLKVNGNITPYKSLKSSGNDQNTSSSTSSTSTSSFNSGQLIDIDLCNGVNNNNNNMNNHHYAERSKAVGKSSSIETDNDEEDSEENMDDYVRIHSRSWNYRAPGLQLVGPNG